MRTILLALTTLALMAAVATVTGLVVWVFYVCVGFWPATGLLFVGLLIWAFIGARRV